MRRAALLGTLSAMAAVVAVVPPASADSPWTPVPDPYTDFEVPAHAWGGACSFPIVINTVVNDERSITTAVGPPAPSGTTLTRIRGRLVVSVSNLDTSKTIVRDVSGPTDTITYPDGTGTQTATGNNAYAAGPHSYAATGVPVFFFTTGPVSLTFATLSNGSEYATSFQGRLVSACNLLAG